jgi:hypothetical protein
VGAKPEAGITGREFGPKGVKKLKRMKNKKMNLIIVILHDKGGIEGEKLSTLEEELPELKPDYQEVVGSQSLYLAFKNNVKNSYKTEMFIQKMESLSARDPAFRDLKVGRHAGLCLCKIDGWGRLKSIPIGIVAYEAIKAAVS